MFGNDSKEYINFRNCVIGNRDVKALYPSINIDIAVKMCGDDCKEEINLRNLVIGSMDVKAL